MPDTIENEDMANPIRDKILKTLRIYTRLSPSMLHTGIGPGIPAALWRKELEQLIQEGKVVETQNSIEGRNYTVLSLPAMQSELRQV